MNRWIVSYKCFDPNQQRLKETLFTLGNGYFATRGAHEDAFSSVHYPATYLAGIYNRSISKVADRELSNEDLINFPNWLAITFKVQEEKEWFNIEKVKILFFHETLSLKKGIYKRTLKFEDSKGRIFKINSMRFVSQHNPHAAATCYSITSENWSGSIQLRSSLIGDVCNAGVPRYQELNNNHLEILEKGYIDPSYLYLKVRTIQSHVEVSQVVKNEIYYKRKKIQPDNIINEEEKNIHQDFFINIKAGDAVALTKILSIYNSKDAAITENLTDAKNSLHLKKSFTSLIKEHALSWKHLWSKSDLEIKTEGNEQLLLRFHIFHALQTLSKHSVNLDYGIPARGLHGEAYRGHVFWDEIYILPFYFYHYPEIARAMLMYRYNRLNAARKLARENGYKGAMFPWQSGSNGEEETQKIHLNPRSGLWGPDHSSLQRHVNLAIVFNIWNYFQITYDYNFLSEFGAEVIFEIANFLNSLTTFNKNKNRFEILGVMGPDEYHESSTSVTSIGLNNNAYTNLMTVWVLERALELLTILSKARAEQLCELLEIDRNIIERWQAITKKMFIPFHNQVISQFEGYDALKEFAWEDYKVKYGQIERLDRILKAEGKNPNEFKIAKQPDTLMLYYNLGETGVKRLLCQLGYEKYANSKEATVNYYQARTCHGSTLSKITFSSILFDSNIEKATELFRQALISDFNDTQGGTTREGIHLGVMVATVTVLYKNFAGVQIQEGLLSLNPTLPNWVNKLKLKLLIRQNLYEIELHPETIKISLCESLNDFSEIYIKDKKFTIKRDNCLTYNYKKHTKISNEQLLSSEFVS